MKHENTFYALYVLTIISIRLGVFLLPERDLMLFGIVIHHFLIGLALALIALLFRKTTPATILFPIGLGLAADQLIFILLGAGKDAQYWSPGSVLGAIILALAIYPLRFRLTKLL